MGRQGFRILDSATHVIDPTDLYGQYLDPAYQDHAPGPSPSGAQAR